MAGRLRGYEISRPQPLPKPHPPPQPVPPPPPPRYNAPPATDTAPWPPGLSRPLSDIREITEPSLMDLNARHTNMHSRQRRSGSCTSTAQRQEAFRREGSVKRKDSILRKSSLKRTGSAAKREPTGHRAQTPVNPYEAGSSSYSTTPEQSSVYAVPQSSVPRRSSSFGRIREPSHGHSRKPSIRLIPPPDPPGLTIPNKGQSTSPVKDAGLRSDAVTVDGVRRLPSRTLIRSPPPVDIMEFPTYKHPRVRLELHVNAPVFVGGGTVEGHVRVTVDDNERLKQRRSIGISAVSVDLMGYEEVSTGRRAAFLALGTELVDVKHPPPATMIEPANPLSFGDKFWTLSPSSSMIPFVITLPLDTGPPPFQSRNASIKFLLSSTALIRDAGRHYRVRTSQEVHVLPTYDPEKALTSLPTPLTATDELTLPRSAGLERIKLTAGLHRQVWVSGSTIFVDIHIANKSRKTVKRLDLSLERDVLCYKHAAAATGAKSASQARVFESNHQDLIAMSVLRAGSNGWNGVEAHTSETRTCDLELPRGHATVRCGKYFEVRYFLNITASVSNSKLVSVQLPIILIHMNSLDVVPNSVAQVAAAIEEKRSRQRLRHHHQRASSFEARRYGGGPPSRQRSVSSPPPPPPLSNNIRRQRSYTQGRAFAAPRQQSLDRQRAEQADLETLRYALDTSPRKHRPQLQGFALRRKGSNISFGGVSLGARSNGGDSAFRAMAFHTPPPPLPSSSAGRYDGIENRSATPGSGTAEDVASIRARMRRMASFDTLHSSKKASARSTAAGGLAGHGYGPWHENASRSRVPILHTTTSRSNHHEIPPHVLGLGVGVGAGGATIARPSFEAVGHEVPEARPSTSSAGLESRSRLDRSRFEFKAVRRKASARGLGMGWWKQMRSRGGREMEREGKRERSRDRDRDRDREGWI